MSTPEYMKSDAAPQDVVLQRALWFIGGAITITVVSMIPRVGAADPVTAPKASIDAAFATSVPRLDEGVDWSKVRVAENPAPMAIAAYER